VHGKGSVADSETILKEATGSGLGTAAFKAHLESRYLSA
jgi:carboxypeptidase Taq